jgi:two-component system, NarL family, sensor histidine kinase DegS
MARRAKVGYSTKVLVTWLGMKGQFVPSEAVPALHEAQTLVSSTVSQLRRLAAQARAESEDLAGQLRTAERKLDEALTRTRVAPTSVNRRLSAEIRASCEALNAAAAQQRHASKQIEQLLRQIEMSSSALSSDEPASADPWALALRAQAIQGREQERTRLAREVHDGPAQVLANSLMLLETCYGLAQQTGHERLVQGLDRLRGASREGLSEVRRFIADLRPGNLDEQGLSAGLQELARRYVSSYGATLTAEIDTLPRLPTETEIVLYRVAQEALQNAYKYARGAPVTLRLTVTPHELRLQIRDEGPGFEPREVARRTGRTNWGFTSMRERAELVSAHFTVASRPGHGTEVLVRLPLTSNT